MRAVIQRVTHAQLTIKGDKSRVVKIGRGIVALIGVVPDDNEEKVKALSDKIINLRIFPNEQDKMDFNLLDIKGELLAVPQFTLLGDCSKGRRPDFTSAAQPSIARPLFERFVYFCRSNGIRTESGEFGAEMLVEITNDGPVTFILDT